MSFNICTTSINGEFSSARTSSLQLHPHMMERLAGIIASLPIWHTHSLIIFRSRMAPWCCIMCTAIRFVLILCLDGAPVCCCTCSRYYWQSSCQSDSCRVRCRFVKYDNSYISLNCYQGRLDSLQWPWRRPLVRSV